MKNWRDLIVSPDTSVVEAVRIIDAGSVQIAIVADRDDRILGTVTDGDVRRGLLKSIPLTSPVSAIMNSNPTTAGINEIRDEILAKMRAKLIRQVPVVDESGRVVSVEILDEMVSRHHRENWVVLMAGGAGTRLRPLTDDCPKPLLRIGKKPLLETILGNFVHHGFTNFFISVNYKAQMIKDYFRDGSEWGVQVEYLEEREMLGTAGCLSLLPKHPRHPIVVMNGDLLTKVNFDHLLDFHAEHRAFATMCVREYDFQVPYGVVRIDKHRIVAIDEKPVHRFFVNAGIYVLDAEAIALIPPSGLYDMPDLLSRIVADGRETAAFPIREYWLDVGRVDDFERANGEFAQEFS